MIEPALITALVDAICPRPKRTQPRSKRGRFMPVTKRDAILRLLAGGASVSEVMARLDVSYAAVKTVRDEYRVAS